jgi:hypothetical protein
MRVGPTVYSRPYTYNIHVVYAHIYQHIVGLTQYISINNVQIMFL